MRQIIRRLVDRLAGKPPRRDEVPAKTAAAAPAPALPAPGPIPDDAEIARIVDLVRAERLTYLKRDRLLHIGRTIAQLRRDGVEGEYLEAGCALGGSTIVIGHLRPADRPLRVHDVFGMIPPPTDADTPDVIERYRVIASGASKGIGGDPYYGYIPDLRTVVARSLETHLTPAQRAGIVLVEGLLQDTLTVPGPVAFAHVDVDWHDPVKACLERIWPRLSPGGCIIVDDYLDWGGCRKATDGFLAGIEGYARDESHGNLTLTRLPG